MIDFTKLQQSNLIKHVITNAQCYAFSSKYLNDCSLFNFTGIPLPLVGLVTYALVTALSLQENRKDLLPGSDDLDIRLILLLTATSMATASAYFLYILSTKFVGVSCSYCLMSAFLSFTLLFIRVKVCGH